MKVGDNLRPEAAVQNFPQLLLSTLCKSSLPSFIVSDKYVFDEPRSDLLNLLTKQYNFRQIYESICWRLLARHL
jgi:hypothetical protein